MTSFNVRAHAHFTTTPANSSLALSRGNHAQILGVPWTLHDGQKRVRQNS